MSGNRVMGLINGGAASSRILARPELLWPVPDSWSLEDAATVPLAYCVAYYCLCIKFELRRGMSVFVHGGAGAIGQAVISIALGYGCTVFTTVSDMRKKGFIRKLFPQIKDDQIGQSRNSNFRDMVLTRTNGNGCNVVITCVSDNLINESIKCCAPCGLTIDLFQIATRDNYSFQMNNLTDDKSFTTIDFPKILTSENFNVINKLQKLVAEGIKCGFVRPLSRIIYLSSESERAFRFIAANRQRGRVLLQLRTDTGNKLVQHLEPRLHCSADYSHLVLCNDDYFGFLIAERLVKRGARKVYLYGLKKSSYVDFKIQSLEKHHVEVKISNQALRCKEDITKLINNCVDLGKVEGIYVVMTPNQSASECNLLHELDLTTRKLCPNIRYFGIVSCDLNSGLETSFSRVHDKLPLTLIKLPNKYMTENQNIDTDQDTIFDEGSINSFEYALATNENILVSLRNSRKSGSILEDIANLADVKIPANLDDEVTLGDLNPESNQCHIISTYLKDYHHLCLSENDLRGLTIKRIKEINNNMIDTAFEDTKGFSTFYSYFNRDELLASTEMMFFPTIVNNTNLCDDEFDVTQIYLTIIPGLEGHCERFRTLCERLKIPAMILQPSLENPYETVSNLAKRFAEVLLKKAQLNKEFYLMGYESGTLVALEIAAILEDHGLTGKVFLVGESPEKFKETLRQTLKKYQSDEELQMAIALHMCNLMVEGHIDGLEDELRKTTTWSEKVETCVRSISDRMSNSAQYARETIECAYGRMKQIQAFKPTPRSLRSKLILIQAASSSEESDRSLQSYSQHPVTVYQLRAPLAHSAADLQCSSIINNHLDYEFLEAFEKRNLCDTYQINSDTLIYK